MRYTFLHCGVRSYMQRPSVVRQSCLGNPATWTHPTARCYKHSRRFNAFRGSFAFTSTFTPYSVLRAVQIQVRRARRSPRGRPSGGGRIRRRTRRATVPQWSCPIALSLENQIIVNIALSWRKALHSVRLLQISSCHIVVL